MANSTESLNPFTPLAFLPPALADQFEQSRYLFAATLGAYVWDIALNLGNDYALLFKRRVHFPTIVYFLSSICFVLSQTATAMLFFLRVTAVWNQSKVAFAMFFILWITVSGRVSPSHSDFVEQKWDPPCTYTEVAAIMPLINDTAIFLAINYRILAHTIVADSALARLRVFFSGTGLSTLSRALLRSGQHFYFIAVATHITLLVLLKLPRWTPIDHGMFAVPTLALVNAMACLVFRRIKFGLTEIDKFEDGADPSQRFGLNTAYPLDVRVQMDIEYRANASQEVFKPTTLA
ncbi:hypothetical protein C8R45DRAFT_1180648 [Mycena sanguinolenta]|nr:hypothetical protein C8R45DRAFT_1180648 [Mycena sanguinolenta]